MVPPSLSLSHSTVMSCDDDGDDDDDDVFSRNDSFESIPFFFFIFYNKKFRGFARVCRARSEAGQTKKHSNNLPSFFLSKKVQW